MKIKKLIVALAIISFVTVFISCKKTTTSTDPTEIATTIELSGDQAVSDNLTEDANDIFMEAALDQNLVGSKVTSGNKPQSPTQTLGILGCATVTVTPLVGFPKNMLIDFGTGCTSPKNITRKGKIYVTLSDSVRKAGSVATLRFDGYYVNGFKKEGLITWTNTSTANIKSWQRKVENGKITTPAGKYWLHSGIKTVVQTEGYSTPRNLLDDVFSITGNHSVTNANGVTRTSVITEPLIKKTSCENISKGKIEMQGPAHTAVIDFGDGTCDKNATISIDGGTPVSFLLR